MFWRINWRRVSNNGNVEKRSGGDGMRCDAVEGVCLHCVQDMHRGAVGGIGRLNC